MNKYVLFLLTFLCTNVWGMEHKPVDIAIPFYEKDNTINIVCYIDPYNQTTLNGAIFGSQDLDKKERLNLFVRYSQALPAGANYYFFNITNKPDLLTTFENSYKLKKKHLALKTLISYSNNDNAIFKLDDQNFKINPQLSIIFKTKNLQQWEQFLIKKISQAYFLPFYVKKGEKHFYMKKSSNKKTTKTILTLSLITLKLPQSDDAAAWNELTKNFFDQSFNDQGFKDLQFKDSFNQKQSNDFVDYQEDRLYIFESKQEPNNGYYEVGTADRLQAAIQSSGGINKGVIDNKLIPLLQAYFSQKGQSLQSTQQKKQKKSVSKNASPRYVPYFMDSAGEIIVLLQKNTDLKGHETYTNFDEKGLDSHWIVEKLTDTKQGIIFQKTKSVIPDEKYDFIKLDDFEKMLANKDERLPSSFQNDMNDVLSAGFSLNSLKESESGSLQPPTGAKKTPPQRYVPFIIGKGNEVSLILKNYIGKDKSRRVNNFEQNDLSEFAFTGKEVDTEGGIIFKETEPINIEGLDYSHIKLSDFIGAVNQDKYLKGEQGDDIALNDFFLKDIKNLIAKNFKFDDLRTLAVKKQIPPQVPLKDQQGQSKKQLKRYIPYYVDKNNRIVVFLKEHYNKKTGEITYNTISESDPNFNSFNINQQETKYTGEHYFFQLDSQFNNPDYAEVMLDGITFAIKNNQNQVKDIITNKDITLNPFFINNFNKNPIDLNILLVKKQKPVQPKQPLVAPSSNPNPQSNAVKIQFAGAGVPVAPSGTSFGSWLWKGLSSIGSGIVWLLSKLLPWHWF